MAQRPNHFTAMTSLYFRFQSWHCNTDGPQYVSADYEIKTVMRSLKIWRPTSTEYVHPKGDGGEAAAFFCCMYCSDVRGYVFGLFACSFVLPRHVGPYLSILGTQHHSLQQNIRAIHFAVSTDVLEQMIISPDNLFLQACSVRWRHRKTYCWYYMANRGTLSQ